MIEITAEIRALIDKAVAGVELAGDEYIDPTDGLIHCKKCGGQRQTVVPCFGKPGYFMPRCGLSSISTIWSMLMPFSTGSKRYCSAETINIPVPSI